MSTVAAFVRLDALTVRPQLRSYLFLLGMGVLFGLMLEDSSSVIAISVVYGILTSSYAFAIEDKDGLSVLYGTLRVPRDVVVVGRYVGALLMFVVIGAVSTALAALLSAFQGETLTATEVLAVLAVSFAIFAFTIGVQFPLFFALGYTRAKLLAYLPFLLVFAAIVAFTQAAPDAQSLPAWLEPSAGAGAVVVVASLAVLVASCLVSRRIYGRKDL